MWADSFSYSRRQDKEEISFLSYYVPIPRTPSWASTHHQRQLRIFFFYFLPSTYSINILVFLTYFFSKNSLTFILFMETMKLTVRIHFNIIFFIHSELQIKNFLKSLNSLNLPRHSISNLQQNNEFRNSYSLC